jgi:hypothetical protein
MTEFQENHIYGYSKKFSKQEKIHGDFDLIILSCGWESRCVDLIEPAKDGFAFNYAAVLSFKLAGELGFEMEYMEKITQFIKSKIDASNARFIENEITDLQKICEDIKNLLLELLKKVNRPLNLAFDITCCPRYVFLFLVAFCLRNDLTKQITIFYSEPNYQTDPKDYIHTRGKWRIIEIPELESRSVNLNRRLFVVSAGWEGKYYRKLIARYEPDHLGILLPNPGFTQAYTEKTKGECQPLREEYNLNDEAVVSAPAGDAVEAWKVLGAPLLNRDDCQITYLTFGTKPHALAMGIRGILHDEISVIYRIPDEYNRIEASGNGNLWKYEFINLIYT